MPASVVTERFSPDPQRPPRTGYRKAALRVLHVINGEHYSGAERVQDLLASKLPQFGFEVGLACLKPDRFPRVCKNFEAPLYDVSMRSKLDLRAVARLLRIIRRGDYRLLHAHTPRTLFVAALASLIAGVPLVYHVHSPTSRDSTRRWRNRLNALIEWFGMCAASALVTVSHSLGRHVRRLGFSARKVFVVPNGVPMASRKRQVASGKGTPKVTRHLPPATRDFCRPCRPQARSVRPEPPVARKHEWTLGTVALFRPRKGLEVLLEALASLRSEGLPVRLRAVGRFETQEYERKVNDLAEKLGLAEVVEWTGFTEDVDGELARMDLFVLPSLFGEGLPMVVLEAMATGVPVVATRVEGVPEAIRDGRDGLLAEPGDACSLAQAIGRVVRGEVDWYALRTSALKRHAEEFSDRSMGAKVAEVYRRVLSAEQF